MNNSQLRNHQCKNLAGKLDFERQVLEKIPYRERAGFISRNAETISQEYCSRLCPYGRYMRRLDKFYEDRLNRLRGLMN